MKALELIAYGKLEYKDVPMPAYGEHEVLVRIKACAICGSDVHGYNGGSGRRIPPLIMGHEAAGVIAEVGIGVKGFVPGDRVTFDSTLYCGACGYCRSGRVNLCDNRRVLGVSCGDYRQHGAMAEYVAVPDYLLYRLPDSVSFEEAAAVEPLTIALHAVNRTRLQIGDDVCVVGAGAIGQLIIKVLSIAGCGSITAVDIDPDKLVLAMANGATSVICKTGEEALTAVLEATGGRGMDAAFEAVGISGTVSTALQSVRKGGEVTLVGNIAAKIDFELQHAVTREIRLNGSCASSGEYAPCLKLLEQKKISLNDIISKRAPLSEGAEWFDRLHRGEKGLIKVVLTP